MFKIVERNNFWFKYTWVDPYFKNYLLKCKVFNLILISQNTSKHASIDQLINLSELIQTKIRRAVLESNLEI